ncbi:DUF799 domain-containing protein [Ferrimonas gelatinilytica]|uniref:DUF799 domain-containing protein n=1 Tax=Ferrimonas gelatinilytica TaxID=1255257 RepID=A0ABP9SBF8_9GAMM
MRWLKRILPLTLLLLAGCVTPPEPMDTSAFVAAAPRSILVLPPVNLSVEVDAPGYFLATISKPLGEKGYYVFPVNTVKTVMSAEGISEPKEMHQLAPTQLGKMFGTDTVLYVTINKWDSQYVVLSTTTVVELEYTIKSAHTGETLWHTVKQVTYTPDGGSSGNPLADLIAGAIVAAMERASPNYMPLARQANYQVLYGAYSAIPAGPYLPKQTASN